MNKVILRGNLTKDVELKTSQSGKQIARFSIAVRRDMKNANGEYESDFLNCISFGNQAEMINKYFHKGSGIIVIGHIQTSVYDGSDGKKVYTTVVIVESIEFDRNNSEKKQEKEKKEEKNDYETYSNFGKKVEMEEKLPWD